MTGNELETFATEVNGGASIGSTFLFQLFNICKALVEQRRPWMVLRGTDTSKTVATSNTWQTAIDLSTITRFNRFYGEYPVRLFDGNNRIERFRQVPFEERLLHKDISNTFCYDEANKTLYLNGVITLAGTLYINHIKDSADVPDTDTTAWSFPSWSHPLLGLMAVGMHKGGVDYDDINARMSPENQAVAAGIVSMLEKWDNEKQLAARSQYDPTDNYQEGFRPGAINIHD
jgi:hypothetical protein